MRHAKEYKRGSRVKAAIFFTVLYAAAVLAFIIPLRPTESVAEKRRLAEFPEFSVSTLMNGDYFADIDTWFADTFPLRDLCFTLNEKIRALYGFTTVQIHGEVTQGDEIPDAPFTGEWLYAPIPRTARSHVSAFAQKISLHEL